MGHLFLLDDASGTSPVTCKSTNLSAIAVFSNAIFVYRTCPRIETICPGRVCSSKVKSVLALAEWLAHRICF